MPQNDFLDFNAMTVTLKGSNLIEASAGTGKTYSIAIMTLRLVIEQGLPLSQVLMVTFTKAAVAELQDRVRLFLRLGLDVSLGRTVADKSIVQLVQQAMLTVGEDKVHQRLQDAVWLIDELAVATIHGFCQQTLSEFAFETAQVFGAEMFTEMHQVIENEVNEFWRQYITTLPVPLLEVLAYDTLKEGISTIVSEQLQGKHYANYDPEKKYSTDDFSLASYDQLLAAIKERSEAEEAAVLQAFLEHHEEITAICQKSKARNKQEFIDCVADPKSFLNLLRYSKENTLTRALPEAFLQQYARSKDFIEHTQEYAALSFRKNLYCFALQEIITQVRQFLRKSNLLNYSDLIQNLYAALTGARPEPLIKVLRQKYKAVFVDEFQDTDKEQFSIFNIAFGQDTLLFLIGDPKQSIYAWRKADIFTYFEARKRVQHRYEMNVNYRSNAGLIEAMNQFFLPQAAFDTFAFGTQEDRIDYLPVERPENSGKGHLVYKDDAVCPLMIFEAANKEDIKKGLAAQIAQLLRDPDYLIHEGGQTRPLRASDIGVLVRIKNDGEGIRQYLAQQGIPAVMLQDAKILDSPEATEMCYLLEAMLVPSSASINRALLLSFTRFVPEDLLHLKEEIVIQLFQEYRDIWNLSGVYPALISFVKDFDVSNYLLKEVSLGGAQKLAVFYQLANLLHQAQYNKEWQQEELLAWLRRSIDGQEELGDAFLLPMESDEEAVRIVTIHKSKGLEYNIVFAPFLDMNTQNKRAWQTYRQPDASYVAKESLLMNDEERHWNQQQLEQENRRLIYVAITRAVYQCYVYKNTSGANKSSSLSPFYQALNALPEAMEQISIQAMPEYSKWPLPSANALSERLERNAPDFKLRQENWYKLSYTSLATHGELTKKDRTRLVAAGTYDHFIFHELVSGAETGNMLHDILEKIDFTKEQTWEMRIELVLSKYLFSSRPQMAQGIMTLLQQVLYTSIHFSDIDFSLSELSYDKRISELEFDFPVQDFNVLALQNEQQKDKYIQLRHYDASSIMGFMNGKVDLFFEYKGKYYILDWKSNYLGNRLEDYDSLAVAQAMNDNNYHLQYLIYSLAVKKYLESRLPDFDYDRHFGGVIYLFLRGLRRGQNTGVYTCRPDKEELLYLENAFGAKG